MNILYVSVHAILEFDEINLLRSLGHFVFPLGSYFGGQASQKFRPEIDFGPELPEWMDRFTTLGGHYSPDIKKEEYNLPKEFIKMFDCCIVMHNPELFELYWESLSVIPVIWRTIGVDTELVERRMLPYRKNGCKIVRYCPTEQRAIDYIGHDSIIRFCKNSDELDHRKRANDDILLFSNDFIARYPTESSFFLEVVRGFSFKLGGIGNDSFPEAIGMVSYSEQLKLLSQSAVYFYCAGSFIPYTLNFMEAWLSGIPVVALDCHSFYDENRCKFAEIPSLITSDEDGFLVSNATQARELFTELVGNPERAAQIGAAGQRKARSLFGREVIAPQWQTLLDSI